MLDTWSARLGVDPHLVRALAWMESGFQTRIVSYVGARGVLQTLPSTRQYVEDVLAGRKISRTVDGDIEVGVLYLRHLLQVFDGDERLALAGWYQGELAVRQHGVYKVSKPFVANVLALRSGVLYDIGRDKPVLLAYGGDVALPRLHVQVAHHRAHVHEPCRARSLSHVPQRLF